MLTLPQPFEEELLEWVQIDHVVRDALQQLGARFRLGPGRMPAPPYIPPEEIDNVEIVPPFWREYPFSIGPTVLPPDRFISVLEYPGVRFSKIVYQNNQWGYEGIIYAK